MTSPLFYQDATRVGEPRNPRSQTERMDRNFCSIATLPSNVEAIDAALQFATGEKPFVALIGPSGWGKTHLLECVSTRLRVETRTRHHVIRASEWISGREVADRDRPMLIDDAQDAANQAGSRLRLRLALERRVRTCRPTIVAVTGDRLTRQRLAFLPNQREWQVHEMAQPSVAERLTIIDKIARENGVQLSLVLSKLMATRMKGNGNTYVGAINRLKLGGADWTSSEEVLMALGLLDRFFADDSGWDLKERVQIAIEKTAVHFPSLETRQLCCFALIEIAGLSELDVARFCEVGPAKARSTSLAFKKKVLDSKQAESAYLHCLETIVDGLLEA